MPFRKTGLKGPVWTSAGRAKLSARQHRLVDEVLLMCCFMYNALVESWKFQYRWWKRDHQYDVVKLSDVYDKGEICGDRGTLYGQMSEYRKTEPDHGGLRWEELPLQVARGVINRFDETRQAFYDRCKKRKEGAKIKAGYPRFRSAARWRTIEIPAPHDGMVKPPSEDGKWWLLCVKGIGVIKFLPYDAERLYSELAMGGRIQEVRIIKTALRVEIHVVVRTVTPDPELVDDPQDAVGLDLGIIKRATFSDTTAFDGVKVDRTEIVKRQRVLSKHDERHKKAKTNKHTPGRKRKVRSLAKAHARVAEKERHSIHRLVHTIIAMCVAGNYQGIAAELLRIQNMMRNRRLADRIQQQRWGMFLRLLELKAARAGIKFVQVDPRHTSLECSWCKNRKPRADLPLSVRIYDCAHCGLVIDRDVNAAINVLIRGFGERFRGAGGAAPVVWSELATMVVSDPATKVTGKVRTADANRIDSVSLNSERSDKALAEAGQTRQYLRMGTEAENALLST